MAKGAVHPNGTNFVRTCKLDIVERMRRLVKQKAYKRPVWLSWVERIPPLELHNLKLMDKRVYNPYHKLVKFALKKYGDLRFQDAFVFGNDWIEGNDTYRKDHPVMQLVSKQLKYMNEGHDIKKAFKMAEEHFYARRMQIEKDIKTQMCIASVTKCMEKENGVLNKKPLIPEIKPFFTTGHAYLFNEIAEAERKHLERIKNILIEMRLKASGTFDQNKKKEEKKKVNEIKKVFGNDVLLTETNNDTSNSDKEESEKAETEEEEAEEIEDEEEFCMFDFFNKNRQNNFIENKRENSFSKEGTNLDSEDDVFENSLLSEIEESNEISTESDFNQSNKKF